jgi:sarcosine oxidase/L-pipecolate oxidase
LDGSRLGLANKNHSFFKIKADQSIIIVGAGAFGLSTALALAKAGYKKITVFDRAVEIPAVDAASNDINKVVRSDYGNDTFYQGLAIESINSVLEDQAMDLNSCHFWEISCLMY